MRDVNKKNRNGYIIYYYKTLYKTLYSLRKSFKEKKYVRKLITLVNL